MGLSISIEVIWFVLMGTLGGISYVFMVSTSWSAFLEFESHKRIILGAIIGFLYFYLHSDWGYPNAVMTWVSGYVGPSFIDNLISKYEHLKAK